MRGGGLCYEYDTGVRLNWRWTTHILYIFCSGLAYILWHLGLVFQGLSMQLHHPRMLLASYESVNKAHKQSTALSVVDLSIGFSSL